MKFFIIPTLFLFNSIVQPASPSVDIEIQPKKPFFEETFEVVISIHTQSQGTPSLSFDHRELDIISQSSSTSVHAQFVRGKFITGTEHKFIYEMKAPSAKTYMLTNVVVEIEGEKNRIPNKAITVIREKERAKSYFIDIETSKDDIYLGEKINVKYYIYKKVSLGVGEIAFEKFPEFKNFIKRSVDVDHQEVESIEHSGEMYRRQLIYSVTLYPSKIGKFYLDPVKVRLAVPVPGNTFSMLRRNRIAVTTSPRKEIIVRPLPTDEIPKNFTGLVGKHDIAFSLNKTKFVVNEVIEGRFEITGEGLLEDFAPPNLYQYDALENFDVKSDILEIDENNAKKIFDYTFIPRSSFVIKSRPFTLSFFDPDSFRYYERTIELPELSASGNAQQKTEAGIANTEAVSPQELSADDTANLPAMVGPIGINEALTEFKNIKTLNIILLIIIAIIIFSSLDFTPKALSRKKILLQKVKKIQKEGVSYSNLYDLLSTYYGSELSAKEIIQKSSLSSGAKSYFQKILDMVGHHEFSEKREKQNIKINYKYFKEFLH